MVMYKRLVATERALRFDPVIGEEFSLNRAINIVSAIRKNFQGVFDIYGIDELTEGMLTEESYYVAREQPKPAPIHKCWG